jgi:hypothetical protein
VFVLTSLTLLLPSLAGAGIPVPDPTKSTVPSYIRVVGTRSGIPDPLGTFIVTVRDFTNLPIAGSAVTLDFINCSDLRLSSQQSQDVSFTCTNETITGITNALGQARFTVVGAGTLTGCSVPPQCAPGAGAGCVRIFADGFQLATATAVIFDLDGAVGGGADGINCTDLSLMLTEVGCANLGGPYRGRVDYSQDGAVNGNDLQFYLSLVLRPALLGSGSVDGTGGAIFCDPAALVTPDRVSAESRRVP